MKKISVVISAFNEEKKIEDCLNSVKWVNEIIVINNSSSDKTASIAQKYTSRIYTVPNNLMLNVNKNYGFSKVRNEWIISIDADERISKELAEEILLVVNTEFAADGYYIPRKNIIFGKWMQHAGWYPDYQLRLFKKNAGKFEEKHVHEQLTIKGKAEYLKEPLLHYNYDSIQQFLYKMTHIYAESEAKSLLRNGYVLNYLDAIRFPAKEFLSRFFAREGYKDGLHGLSMSMLMAFYHFIVFAYIWEQQGFKQIDDPGLLAKVEDECKSFYKDILYWTKNEKIKKESSTFKKIALKAGRKIFRL